jgi:hypothetical protein
VVPPVSIRWRAAGLGRRAAADAAEPDWPMARDEEKEDAVEFLLILEEY